MYRHVERLWVVNDNYIIEKMICFYNGLMRYYPDDKEKPDMDDLFETDERYWSDDMRILYAEVRVLTQQNEFLGSILEQNKPSLLEGPPDQQE